MKWELYSDESYFGLWAVRPEGDRSFESPRLFHFQEYTDALNFKNLAEKAR